MQAGLIKIPKFLDSSGSGIDDCLTNSDKKETLFSASTLPKVNFNLPNPFVLAYLSHSIPLSISSYNLYHSNLISHHFPLNIIARIGELHNNLFMSPRTQTIFLAIFMYH